MQHTVTVKLIPLNPITLARLSYWHSRMIDNISYAQGLPYHRAWAERITDDYFAQIEQVIEASHA